MSNPVSKASVVVGASSGIAQAVIRRLLAASTNTSVIAISRSAVKENFLPHEGRLRWMQSDYTDASMSRVADDLREESFLIDRIFVCNGVLHDEHFSPEKRLKDISRDTLADVFQVNAVIPLLWLKNLLPLLKSREENVVTVFSARVGSIEDNRKGGWHAYRASKAALNMAMKSVAIEYRRIFRSTKFLAFHPGTTDTELSKPFQQQVPEGQLFHPDFVAEKLLGIIKELPDEPELNFMDWAGKPVAW